MLYNLILTPIEYLLDTVFCIMARFLDNNGLAIIFVSLAVQLLTLPLYRKSDEIQEAERQKQKSMEHWVSHIRKNFRGNERFMMLQAYYRQQHYRPIYALKGSVSLLLQIPFFIAAYNFLSGLTALEGESFLFIKDLASPDAIIRAGSVSINLLPILMTAVNIVSGMIYTKGFTRKEKVQLYGMALIFLVILYDRPSGLVLYWTMNNVFSLVRNIFTKLVKNKKRFLSFLSPVLGASLMYYVLFLTDDPSVKANMLAAFVLALSLVPPALYFVGKRIAVRSVPKTETASADILSFFLAGFFLALFTGLHIPLTVISSSPLEFLNGDYGPAALLTGTTMTALGFFCVWGSVFFLLGSARSKRLFSCLYLILTAVFIADFFFFGKNLGVVSSFMVFDRAPSFTGRQKALNLAVLAFSTALAVFLFRKAGKKGKYIYAVLCISILGFAVVRTVSVSGTIREFRSRKENSQMQPATGRKMIPLSKKGKNVVLFMLDRAVSGYIPYIMKDNENVASAFSDFTYYPDTISYGGHTNLGSPSIFGGYEYSPAEMNRRSDEKLVAKHNEALKVLPVLFLENNWSVTVCDPPYANYSWIPDLSIYSSYPEISAYNLTGLFANDFVQRDSSVMKKSQTRSIFFYSIFKVLPLVLQNPFYDGGKYWTSSELRGDSDFTDSASTLFFLSDITRVTEDGENTFLMIQNETPHSPTDRVLSADYSFPDSNYAVNMYSYIQIARWIEFMKENGVYDNTKIIIVADHGVNYGQFDYMKLSNGVDVQYYNPVLLIKDFTNEKTHSEAMRTDNSFMTTSDAAVAAVNGVIDNPVNPFTGKALDGSQKYTQAQYVTTSENFLAEGVTSNRFDTSDGRWFRVSGNIFDESNWEEVQL